MTPIKIIVPIIIFWPQKALASFFGQYSYFPFLKNKNLNYYMLDLAHFGINIF